MSLDTWLGTRQEDILDKPTLSLECRRGSSSSRSRSRKTSQDERVVIKSLKLDRTTANYLEARGCVDYPHRTSQDQDERVGVGVGVVIKSLKVWALLGDGQ
eukprot:scaffold1334_cov114-Skeletonema_dohrnii-CCMP3373.AAC.3